MRPLVLGVVLFVTACSTYEPMFDPRNENSENQIRDLYECRQLAERASSAGDITASALIGGVGTGVTMAGANYIGLGDQHVTVAQAGGIGFAGGALGGLLVGLREASEREDQMVRKCLEGRGHTVLE